MKKIWNKILYFWYFVIKNRKRIEKEKGGFRATFRDYDMTLETLSKNFSMRVRSSEHSVGYLAVSAIKGPEDNLWGFAKIMYILGTSLTRDEKLAKEVQRAIARYMEREEVKAAAEGRKEDDAANRGGIELTKKDEERAHMSRAERRRAEREFQKKVKNERANK